MFWIALLWFLITAAALLRAVFADEKFISGAVTVAAAVVGVLFLIGSMISVVDTKHLGIVKAYNKPTGRVTGAGLQWTKPWEGIDDSWDATRQPYNHLGDKCDKPGDGSLWVTIAGQRNMCVRVQVNWQVADVDTKEGQKRAADNWATYRDRDGLSRFEVFEAAQVVPGINDALLATFRTFDPMSLLNKDTGEMVAPDLGDTYTTALTDEINKRLDKDIKVMSISWGLLGSDAPTTTLISQYSQKILEKRNLTVDNQNAGTRKAIASNTGVPAAVQQCLDLIKLLNKGEPGLCLSGSGVTLTRPVS